MLQEYKSKTNTGVGFGILLHFVSGLMYSYWDSASLNTLVILATVVAIAGTISFFYGLASYSKGKGYSSSLGILGIFGLIGLIILVIMPDKNK